MTTIKQLYQYLQATKNLKIIYCDGFTEYPCLEIYTNADWAGNKKTQKLT